MWMFTYSLTIMVSHRSGIKWLSFLSFSFSCGHSWHLGYELEASVYSAKALPSFFSCEVVDRDNLAIVGANHDVPDGCVRYVGLTAKAEDL